MANALVRIIGALLLVSCPVACTHGWRKPALTNWPEGAGGVRAGEARSRQDCATAAAATVHIRNVRLELVATVPTGSSASLKFTMRNQGSRSVSDVALRVSVAGTDVEMDSDPSLAIVAGPYVIRSKSVLLPGYSVDFDVGLGSIGSECACIGKVEIIAARFASPHHRAKPRSNQGTSVIADQLRGTKDKERRQFSGDWRRASAGRTWIRYEAVCITARAASCVDDATARPRRAVFSWHRDM
jgi:hypothetical protein